MSSGTSPYVCLLVRIFLVHCPKLAKMAWPLLEFYFSWIYSGALPVTVIGTRFPASLFYVDLDFNIFSISRKLHYESLLHDNTRIISNKSFFSCVILGKPYR